MKHLFALAAATLTVNFALANAPAPSLATVSANNTLGTKLMRESIKTDVAAGRVQNTMTSPLSAYLALSMALNGTATDTRTKLLSTLNIFSPAGEEAGVAIINGANSRLQDALSVEKVTDKKRWENPPTVTISNAAWNTNGKTDGRHFEFTNEFKGSLQSSYKAEIGALDFRKPEAADEINKWVDVKTNNLIKKIIDADALSELLWVIINATYFEASWAKPFYVVQTEGPNFVTAAGKEISANMIRSSGDYAHYVDKKNAAEVIELPFSGDTKGKTSYSMVIALPNRNVDLQKSLQKTYFSDAFWTTALESLKAARENGSIQLPKFSFDYTVEMKDQMPITKAMDLQYLFENSSDFSAMSTRDSRPSKVGIIKQSTRIELDEKGVKAAAVTLIGGVERTSAPARPTFAMNVDRPFVYAIVERNTGAILFLGSVVDPGK